ncbi:MAG: hypothetical protein H0U49_06035, partial [Parachlamydiaceae bacterium]|nr:hypothetical protein [Parachlamydiaceae bacterium]
YTGMDSLKGSPIDAINKNIAAAANLNNFQDDTESDMKSALQTSVSNTSGMVKTAVKTLSDRTVTIRKVDKQSESGFVRQEFEEASNDLLEKHRDFNEDGTVAGKTAFLGKLKNLQGQITPSMSEEDVIAVVQKFCEKKPSSTVDVLDFLLKLSSKETEKVILNAKQTCEFCAENPEFAPGDLIRLSKNMTPGMKEGQVLQEIESVYGRLGTDKTESAALIAKAFKFLKTTGTIPEETKRGISREHDKFTADNRDQISYSLNVGNYAQKVAKGNVAIAKEYLTLHNQIKGNLPEVPALFTELSTKYTSFEQLKGAYKFLIHSIGEEVSFQTLELGKRKLPEGPELQRLMEYGSALRSIFFIYKYTESKMPLLASQFEALKGG